MTARRFALALGALTLVAFGLRLAYALTVGGAEDIGDDIWYHQVANGLADGRGFSDPFASLLGGRHVAGDAGDPIPTAFHPPFFPMLLAVFSKVGLTSYTAHQLVGCALGACTAAVAGLVARRLWDARAGLAGAGIAALYPQLVANDSTLYSESLYGLVIAVVLLAAIRFHDEPGRGRGIALGAALAAAAYTRQEALALAFLLAPWVAWRARPRDAALVLAVLAVLAAPWAIRNTTTFDQPVVLASGEGAVIAGANLPRTYHGPLMGGWDFYGLYGTPAGRHPVLNEAVQSDRWRKEGVDYARDHAGRLPAVAAARIGRTWGLYPLNPRERAAQVAFVQSKIRRVELAAYPAGFVAWALALVAAVALRRRGAMLWPLAAPILLVTAVSVVGYGDPRFAQAGNVAVVVLAGVGAVVAADGAISRWRRRAGRPASGSEPAPRAAAAAPPPM